MTDSRTDLTRAARAAEQAAYAAGTHLQASRSRLSEIVITHQAPEQVVAAIDREARALIREVVLKHLPDHQFLGDGGTSDAPCWVVDPIDGRANYLRGYPLYAVSIAMVEAGDPVVGVIYDPSRNEFFGAIRGRGAVLNAQPIHCAARRNPAESLAATVFPRSASARMPVYMAELGRMLRAFSGVRRSGSMALELACLAAGRIDAFWQHDMGPCDAAAAIVLLRESGALVTARDGRPLLESASVMACTPPLYEPFLSLLAEP
jgi:myo-inositol-1(or 4)-monophosphatase